MTRALKKIFSFVTAFVLICGALYSQEKNQQQKERPSVALVLSGGGALGVAHIPFLEMIEEIGIPVDMIIGNSAGSIIGALYAAGYTPEEIYSNWCSISWQEIFNDATYTPFEHSLGSHGSTGKPVSVQFGDNFALQMGSGFLTGQKTYELFKGFLLDYPSDLDFDKLPVPFRAVATELLTGKLNVFDSGDLAEAVRASISIPTVFQAFEIDGTHYIDGLARSNFPLQTAYDLGYDIVIGVDLQDYLFTDQNEFEDNPLLAFVQIIFMEQAVRKEAEYGQADLIVMPEVTRYNMVQYDKCQEIYELSKQNTAQYAAALQEIKDKYFPDTMALTSREKLENGEFKKEIFPVELEISGAIPSDEAFIRKLFASLEGKPLSKAKYKSFMNQIYGGGNYSRVITRFYPLEDDSDKHKVCVICTPKKTEKAVILLGMEYEGTMAMDSSRHLLLTSEYQYRNLTGHGSILSASTAFLDGTEFHMMFLQPIFSRSFVRLSADYEISEKRVTSGWVHHNLEASEVKEKAASLEFAFPFSSQHTLFTGAGIHFFDTSQSAYKPAGGELFTGDFFLDYTFSSLNHPNFPTKGAYVNLSGTGVIPFGLRHGGSTGGIFEKVEVDAYGAIPFGNKWSLLLLGYAGMNISQQLLKTPQLMSVYGFSTGSDRRLFPQISGAGSFGLHKFAIGASLQFMPWNQLTVLGGQMLFSVSGAVGNVWKDYASLTLADLEWRSSFDTVLRVTDAFSAVIRIGAGTMENRVRPFVSLDFGTIRF
ncbi:MAG: patatin-like phospholipase family protein [Treponemataceae bacterium]|nr:patatin-like phospholipase family protein [Treponemataceae bacterium]